MEQTKQKIKELTEELVMDLENVEDKVKDLSNYLVMNSEQYQLLLDGLEAFRQYFAGIRLMIDIDNKDNSFK